MNWLQRLWWRLVRFGFRLLYHEFAWTYDIVSRLVSFGKWRTWQHTVIKHLPTESSEFVLELAHGTGNLQLDLTAAGFRAIGLDVSRQMGRQAYRKLQSHGLAARLVQASALQLPFPSNSFPAIVSTFPTPFIVHPDTLQEVSRVLLPGGRFVVVLTGLLTSRDVLTGLFEWLYRITGQRQPFPNAPFQQLEEAGFDYDLVKEKFTHSTVLLLVATLRQDMLGQTERGHT